MKNKLLEEIKEICIYEYFDVVGMGFNVRQLRAHLEWLRSRSHS